MNKLSLNCLAVILFTTVVFSSCSRSVEFEKADQQHTVYYTDSSSCSIDVQFLYPSQYKNTQVLALVQQEITAAIFGEKYKTLNGKTAIDEYIKNTVTEFILNKKDMDAAEEANDKEDDLPPIIYNEEWVINTSILYNEKNILSYAITRYTYLGGAHGLENTGYLVLNLKTGKRIQQQDIFTEGYEKSIAAILKAQIMKDGNFATEDELIENGYIFHEEIKANGNFFVDEEGIHYIFAPYEIAAYVVGETEVVLSYKDLKPFLRKDSPIAHIYSKRWIVF
jgi:hypothetical protein